MSLTAGVDRNYALTDMCAGHAVGIQDIILFVKGLK